MKKYEKKKFENLTGDSQQDEKTPKNIFQYFHLISPLLVRLIKKIISGGAFREGKFRIALLSNTFFLRSPFFEKNSFS